MVSRSTLDLKGTDQGMKTRQHSRGTSEGDRLFGMNVKFESWRGRSWGPRGPGVRHAGSDCQAKESGLDSEGPGSRQCGVVRAAFWKVLLAAESGPQGALEGEALCAQALDLG